ncbi:hypothetical protein [Streptomyces radicis]|uniref:Band 7 domain-containing protein n=1 Tax=Streptomyces radicis TaxID=1750517 RepID=A0A3A9WPM3_9ACTN|nr:hypothetical protein [Streptomyces radicis]RKN11454.1 hypothetical protein D7319_05795 [Streptomyces radicis]RKN26828.1 hypothetical protein D7318_03865 [Streptomyces radicis]
MNYPVVAEHALSPVQRSWWSRRQQRTDMPALPPGAVYVLMVGGQYRAYPHGAQFDPAHADVVDASSVSLVDIRTRMVEVERTVPSVSAADAFTIRASFTCQVTDPTAVARHGITDVCVPLRSYLAADSELPRMSAGHRIEEVNAVRAQVTHRMTAYSAVVAPRVPGMTVEFVGIEVLTPDDLSAWERRVRDEHREQELEQARRAFERDGVLSLADLLAQGSNVADALGLSRDRIDIQDIAARIDHVEREERDRRHKAEDEDKARAHALELEEKITHNKLLLAIMQRVGTSGDYVDYGMMLQQLLNHQGSQSLSPPDAKAVGPGAGGERRGGGEPHGDFIKDEDDLVD